MVPPKRARRVHGHTLYGCQSALVITMKKVKLRTRPAVTKTVDRLLGFVPWTKRRTVIIYLREHGGRRYVRLRTFNQHRTEGHWYPSPRYFMVPIKSAAALGKAIIAAGKGRPFGEQPDWWADFEKQYQEYQASKAEAEEAPDANRSDAPSPS